MNETAELLRKARKLIEDPERWVNREPPHDGVHCAVTAISRVAVSMPFCLGFASDTAAIQAVKDANGIDELAEWNDTHSHAEVLAAFDRAIAEAEKA